MALSIFDDRHAPPDAAALRRALGDAAPLWDRVVSFAGTRWPPIEEELAYSGRSAGWSVRLRRNGKILLYLIPREGSFLAGIVLGDRAVRGALEADLPSRIVEMIRSAKRYAEGTGIRFEVRDGDELRALERLMEIRMASSR